MAAAERSGRPRSGGPRLLLVTANVGSMFEDTEHLQKNWLQEFYKTVHSQGPQLVAVHCQEVGGKNYEESMANVEMFVKELLSSEEMREFNRARVYLDENYKSKEHFTALGNLYFLHESLRNTYQFDFKARKFKKVTGKEIYSDTLDSTTMLEKEKFPQEFFPECKWSRKGYIRTRWSISDSVFDLINIHLFHDASNITAWEESPSVYSSNRQRALSHVLDRISDRRYQTVPFFIFGDFNFRLDARQVVESLCGEATLETVKTPNTDEVDRVVYTESNNDRKVVLRMEKKLFEYIHQGIFREDNGSDLHRFDREFLAFKDRLWEQDIGFPPSYPYSEDSSQGRSYMNTRCPAWCDRVLMSHSARELFHKGEGEDTVPVYNNIGANVCMGDHKPVFLCFRLVVGADKKSHRQNGGRFLRETAV
ncbi:inositol polyphosphate-5-phosphatase A isoform X1 [Lampetra fluviatilis]